MFDSVDPKQSFPALEKGILKYWQEEDAFKRSMHMRGTGSDDILNTQGVVKKSSADAVFSFYDGPPFATGLPHYGHLLAGTIKDVIPRYQTMRGNYVQRRFGWDCHGLPIENIIEKEHNIKDKQQIEDMGVKAFNDLCRGAVQRYTKEWRNVVERMGRWVDMDWDYKTMDAEYMESIWWGMQKLHEKGLLYEGHKPMHVCPRCVTPLSNFEVTQGYKDVTDQSATVMFKVKGDASPSGKGGSEETGEGVYILAWTTTPWTLPGNVLLTVHKNLRYVKVKHDGKTFIVAEKRVDDVFKGKEFSIDGTPMLGSELIGKTYEPLFPYFAQEYATAFRVVDGSDFVTDLDGTGIVHIAMGFGEDDFNVGKREKIKLLQHVTLEGKFTADVTDFAGQEVKPADDPTKTDRKIADWLKGKGLLFDVKSFKHSYPHCWRCDHPLLNYATSSWFVAVEQIKETMIAENKKTHWVPGHIRDGRFGKWLENARDWAISRNRYWGNPLPVWRNRETGETDVIGSRDELMQRLPIRFTRVSVLRHAESDGNVTPRYQGKVPGTDLTGKGRKQAAEAGTRLSKEKVSIIYCSPLNRTRQTAEEVARKTGARVVVDERLREVEFGEYEGKSVDFSDLTFVKARRAHKLENGKVESIYHFPGMETWSQVQARTHSFLREILPRHRGEHVVIVTHADPVLNITHYFTGEDPAKLTNQPYPNFASPRTFFWDHDMESQLDLHKEVVDGMAWAGKGKKGLNVELTVVRHGQSEWNRDGILQGQEGDPPLTELGLSQAKETAHALKKHRYDGIVCSDAKRARQTAEVIAAELALPILEQTPLLRERKFGTWAGKPLAEVLKAHPLILDSGEFGIHHETPEGGESLSRFFLRAEELRAYLLAKYPGKNILVVSHGGFIQALRTVLDRLPYAEALKVAPKNCEATRMTLHPLLTRTPEVLDCWAESGAMPYAQMHYPFANGGKHPPAFPADFIAEGIDQTRGWFYTLTVLSTALFGKIPFKNCIVNGTVLASDGKKMSKRLKNYPEPLEIVEKHGADAVRFALMSSPAVRGEDLRFSEKLVEETLRSVLLPLWNTYSFFVTYANGAGFQPVASRRSSNHPLDTWIKAEIQDLVNRMTEQLEDYDLSATCAELGDTIDALTNWYVRLSRRRFAGKAGLHEQEEAMEEMHEQDRLDALTTLYDVLITLCQLLAPFCPFITDAIYLNLVPEEHGSIHFTDWPATRKLKKNETELLSRTRLLRTLTSLGLKIRSEKKIKVRQPLGKATVAIPETMLGQADFSAEERALLQEELNVQDIELVDDPGSIAQSIAQVDARKVGPRLGQRVQELIKLGKEGQFTVEKNGDVTIAGERLTADEAPILYRGREGQDVAADRGIVVALDTRITEELKNRGAARDLIRAVQQARKDAGLQFTDRITLQVSGADAIMKDHAKTILDAVSAVAGTVEGPDHSVETDAGTFAFRFLKS